MCQDSEEFLKLQAVKGKKGGNARRQSRKSKANNHRIAAQALKDEGMPLSEIARVLGVSRNKVINFKLE